MTGSAMTHPNTAVANIGITPFDNYLLTISPVGEGTDSVQITMIDPEGSATQQLNVRVFSGPDTNGTMPDVSLDVGGSSTDVDVSAYFDASDMSDLSYTAVSSDTAKATVSVSGATLTVTPVAGGTATITARAVDSSGKFATQTFTVTVVQPNRSPVTVGTISDQSIKLGGAAIVIDVAPYFSDPDGDTLSYTCVQSGNGFLTFTMLGSVLTMNTHNYKTGTSTMQVVATDPDSASAEQRFTITVLPANRAPVANGTIPGITAKVGHSATDVDLSGYFTDADSDTLTYHAVSSDASKATVSLSDATLTVTPVAQGTATITTTATDPDGALATQTFTITVNQANRPPVASVTIPAHKLNRGITTNAEIVYVVLSDYFSDPDGDALTYTATAPVGTNIVWPDFRRGPDVVSLVPIAPHPQIPSGTTTVTVTATDTDNASVSQSFSVTTSIPPVPKGTISDVNVYLPDETFQITNLQDYFSDADGDTLTYSASSSNTSAVTVSVSGTTVTFSPAGQGSATITITATDVIDLTATQTLMAYVGNPPTTVGTISDKTHGSNWKNITQTLDVSPYFSDPNGLTLTYSVSSSDTATVLATMGTGSVVNYTPNAAGTATITVTATNTIALSVSTTFNVTLQAASQADAVAGLSSGEQSLLGQLLTYDTLIFNELHNASDDANDWLELRNVSNVDIPLDNWQFTVQTGSGNVVIPFPTGTVIPAGEVLLVINTDNPVINGEAVLPIVSEDFALPQTAFALILRSPTAFGDLAGNYFQDRKERSETAPELTVDTVWYRSQATVSGYRAEAWAESTTQDGLGTPGYRHASEMADLNNDGVVNILDLVLVASQFGTTDTTADLNADGAVNIQDLVMVANALGGVAAAPAAHQSTAGLVNTWLRLARQNETVGRVERSKTRHLPEGFSYERGIFTLEQLARTFVPETTALLANYPNPFNPETWIPYQLSKATEVTVTIYATDGSVVRTLALGHQDAGMYKHRSQAAYWDGRNALGETVASGIYFYTLSTESTRDSVTAGTFTATRKMLILK